MPLPQTRLDPDGLYARLGVSASAPPEEIAAAFRRKARVLHPDVPGTGDTDAFVAARQAYDVLADRQRRAIYDRTARRAALEAVEVGEIEPDAPATMPAAPMRHPRLSDLPLALWIGAAILICLGIAEAAIHLSGLTDRTREASVASAGPVTAPPAPPVPPVTTAHKPAASQPEPVRLAGTPNYYIVPAAGPTVLWHHDTDRNAFVPEGQLPPFSAVQAVRLFRQNGLVEVRVTDSATGLVEAARLAPGDADAARRAYCAYYAGPLPDNGEILERHVSGPESLDVSNRTAQPVVLKLRDPAGVLAVSVFLAPGGHVTVPGLASARYRADYAIGELWSRACNGFAAGMRAQRLAEALPIRTLSPLAIPPDRPDGGPPQDIPDRLFEGE